MFGCVKSRITVHKVGHMNLKDTLLIVGTKLSEWDIIWFTVKKNLFVSLCSGLVKFCTAFISVVSHVKLLLMLHASHTLHVPLTKLECNYC